jgi:drug/metabolite transporter (DMT)-like permease
MTKALVSQIAAMLVYKGVLVVIEAEIGDLSRKGYLYCVLSLILWTYHTLVVDWLVVYPSSRNVEAG